MEDCVEYKLDKLDRVFNVLGLCVYLGFDAFFVVGLIFMKASNDLKLLFFGVISIALFSYGIFFFSKKVLGIKWYDDKFVLCTRYGEKNFSFDISELHRMNYDKSGKIRMYFKKKGLVFQIGEDEYPDFVKALHTHYAEYTLMPRKLDEYGEAYVTYRPLVYHGSMAVHIIIWIFTLFLWAAVIFFCIPNEIILRAVIIFFVLYGMYASFKTVFEIKMYKDKFVLCTYCGEKVFFVDRTELDKIRIVQGYTVLVFKNNIMSFNVDERDFPKVVDLLKSIYAVE